MRGYRDITPAICSPEVFAPIGLSRPGCSPDDPPFLTVPQPGRRRRLASCVIVPPFAVPGDGGMEWSLVACINFELSSKTTTSRASPCRDDRDVAGLLGRDADASSSVPVKRERAIL